MDTHPARGLPLERAHRSRQSGSPLCATESARTERSASLGCGEVLESVCGGCGATRARERTGDALRSRSQLPRLGDCGTKVLGAEPPGREPDTGSGDLDPTGHLGLVAPERNGDDGHTVCERLLGVIPMPAWQTTQTARSSTGACGT